jgi:hypothetical protein
MRWGKIVGNGAFACVETRARTGSRRFRAAFRLSKDDADERGNGYHEKRRKSKKPDHPKLASILIGLLLVAE